MKKISKQLITITLCCMCMLTLMFYTVIIVNAEQPTDNLNNSVETSQAATTFAMEEGASVRKTGGVGIRFRTFVPKSYLENNSLDYNKINFGTEFILSNRDSNNVRDLNIDKTKIYQDANGNYIYNSVIHKIPQNNYTTNITARSFIKKEDNTRIYVENPQYRSVHYVATKALENGEVDGEGILQMIKDTGDNKNLLANFDDNSNKFFTENSSTNEIVSVIDKKLNVKSNGTKPESVLKVSQSLFENVEWSKISKIKFTITNKSDDGATLIIRLNGEILSTWLNKETKTIEIDSRILKQKIDDNKNVPLQIVFYKGNSININLDFDNFEIVSIPLFSSDDATCTELENGVNIKADGKNVSTLIIRRDYFSDVNWQNVTKFSFTVNNKSSDGGELRININNVRLATPWLNRVEATFTVDAKQLKDNLDKFPNDNLRISFASGVINMNLDYYDFKFIEKEFFRPIGNTKLTKIENGYNLKAHGNEVVLEIDRSYFDNIDSNFTKFTFKVENKCNDASSVMCRVASEVFADPWLNTNSTIDVTFELSVLKEKLKKYPDKHLQIVFWTGNVNDKELNLTNFKFI